MRKLIIAAAIATLTLTGCDLARGTGTGQVTALERDPAEYYSFAECVRKFSKARCLAPVLKEPKEYEIKFTDAGSGVEQEAEVSLEIFNACKVGDIFNGTSCLTPSPSAS